MSSFMNGLENFGYCEINEAIELLEAYRDNSKPGSWSENGVFIDYNHHSGAVFLTNHACQVLSLDPDYGLCLIHNAPYNGNEGTLPDLCKDYLDSPTAWESIEDREFLIRTIDGERAFFSGHEDSGDILPVIDKVRKQILLDVVQSNIDQVVEAVKHEHPDFKVHLGDEGWLDDVYQSHGAGLFADMDLADDLVEGEAMKDWFFEALKNETLFK